MAEMWRCSERNIADWRTVDDSKMGSHNTQTALSLQNSFIRCQVDAAIFHGQEK